MIKRKTIYIWGAGHYAEFIYSIINKETCEVKAFIDNDKVKQNRKWKCGLTVWSPDSLLSSTFDYIFISPKDYEAIEMQCIQMGIQKEKIIVFWKDSDCGDLFLNRAQLAAELNRQAKVYRHKLENAPYEWGLKPTPIIKSGVELLKLIYEKKYSLSRFGDGEFEVMLMRERPWFQKPNFVLAKRLEQILKSNQEGILITIPQNFGNLDCYTEASAEAIREYVSGSTRMEIMSYLNLEQEYYDSYVSRPYIMYKEKNIAKETFALFRKIFEDRRLIIVEGQYSRFGVGNDFLSGSKSVKRILCPSKDAWDKYEEILACVKHVYEKGDLVCVILGPTATVLTYDLAGLGIQALDVGQVDNEYEWYLRDARTQIPVKGKLVAEAQTSFQDYGFYDADYARQIVAELF